MHHNTGGEAKNHARELYIKDRLGPAEIAAALGVSASSVYGWRRADARTAQDWDKARAAWHLSPREMIGGYAQQVREFMLDLTENPEKMASSKTADALAKHIANLQKLNPKHLYMGALLDLINETDKYLAEHDNALRERINQHWPGIRRELTQLLEQEIPLV